MVLRPQGLAWRTLSAGNLPTALARREGPAVAGQEACSTKRIHARLAWNNETCPRLWR